MGTETWATNGHLRLVCSSFSLFSLLRLIREWQTGHQARVRFNPGSDYQSGDCDSCSRISSSTPFDSLIDPSYRVFSVSSSISISRFPSSTQLHRQHVSPSRSSSRNTRAAPIPCDVGPAFAVVLWPILSWPPTTFDPRSTSSKDERERDGVSLLSGRYRRSSAKSKPTAGRIES